MTDRSHTQADFSAPGIQMPTGASFSISIGNYNLVITAADWNTIVASSQVESLVGAEFAPDFNSTSIVTRNRFQYLADEISLHYDGQTFEPLSVISAVSGGAVVDDVALYNPTEQVSELSGLTDKIVNLTSMTTVASETFYGSPGTAIVIPARTIYFARLVFSADSIGAAQGKVVHTQSQFHYAQFKPCPGQVCS